MQQVEYLDVLAMENGNDGYGRRIVEIWAGKEVVPGLRTKLVLVGDITQQIADYLDAEGYTLFVTFHQATLDVSAEEDSSGHYECGDYVAPTIKVDSNITVEFETAEIIDWRMFVTE